MVKARSWSLTRLIMHVYNWADYIGECTINDFETRSGTKVTCDVFDSPDILATKLLTGRSGYDVVFPSGVHLRRDISAGVFLKRDKSKLPNLANMDPAMMKFAETYDPGNQHAIDSWAARSSTWALPSTTRTRRISPLPKRSPMLSGSPMAMLPPCRSSTRQSGTTRTCIRRRT